MSPIKTFLIVLSLGAVITIGNTSVFAAELFRKQTGTATIAAGAASVTVTIPAVCLTQSFLVFSVSTNDADPSDFLVGGRMTNATTLTFSRFGTGTESTIKWQVFEFEGNVTVQRGTTNLTATPIDVAITAVDLTKTFVIATMTNSGGGFGSGDSFAADLTSTTNLRLFATNATPNTIIYWQVIQYQDAVVKKFSTNLPAGTASTTTTIVPAITTLSKAMVISNHTIDADVVARDLPRTELTNSTTVTYTRGGGTTAAMNFVTYVVEFTDLTTVARATVPFPTGTITANRAVTAAVSTGIFGPGNQGRQGSTNHITDDNLGHAWFYYELTTLTNLLIRRAVGTGSAADAPYQLVTFEDQYVSPRTYYSFASGAWESNTSWSLSSDGSSGAVGVGVYPRRSDNVVIRTGHNITINSVTDNGLCGLSPDNLSRSNVGLFSKSGNIMFYQTGDILISGTLTVVGVEMMIEGFTKIVSGGTFTLGSDLVNLGYLEADAGSTFSTLDDISLAGNSTTVINTNSISSDDLNISFTNATLCGTGSTTLTNGLGSVVTYFNGATVAQICTTFTVACSGGGCSGFPVIGTTIIISGNSGPSGVGNSTYNKLWLMADNLSQSNNTSVTSWADGSGNALTAANAVGGGTQPTFLTNSVNSILPTISFDGGDWLTLGTPASLNLIPQTDSWSTFFAFNVSDGNPGTIFSKATSTSGTRQYQYTIDATNPNRFAAFLGGSFSNSGAVATGAWTIGTGLVSASATGYNTFLNETADMVAASVGTGTVTTTDVLVGARRIDASTTTSGFNLTGNIGEVILYNTLVNTAQRIIIDNYLSAKYAITLGANDVYLMDNSGNGNYDFEVAGIGQAADGTKQIDSKGTGMVRMWNPNNLGNSEFLIWGRDNSSATSGTSSVGTSVDGTVIKERLTRIWRVSETGGDVGTVSISFDYSSLLATGSPLGSNLRLLIDRDGDGFADNDVTPVAGSSSGNIVVFSGVDFQDGDRFTLGNTSLSTPLPIELLTFNASVRHEFVLLDWSTATELNNDFFTIERMSEGDEKFNALSTIKGAGTKSTESNYEWIDKNPLASISYYRLKQTDFDGKYTYSDVRVIENNSTNSRFSVYPNPIAGNKFTLEMNRLPSNTEVPLAIVNMQGAIVHQANYRSDTGGNLKTIVEMNSVPSGIYMVVINAATGLRKKIVIP